MILIASLQCPDQKETLQKVQSKKPLSSVSRTGGFTAPAGQSDERAALDAFVRSRVAKVESGYYCLDCGTTIRHVNNVRRHVVTKHGDSVLATGDCTYRCPACASEFRSTMAIRSHIASRHPPLKGLDPEQCRIKN